MTKTSNKSQGEPPVIHLQNVSVSVKGRDILSKVSLQIHQGEFVYIVGKTGAGKSSLLKTFYGDIPIHTGKAEIANTDLTKLSWRKIPKFRRMMGIVSQDFPLLNYLNVFDNLKFVLKATGWVGKKKIEERIHQVLERVFLLNKAKSMPYELSAGEAQRIQVARALVNNVSLVLADEPTASLDPQTSVEIISFLQQLCRKWKMTFVVSTNDHEIIRSNPSRIISVKRGLIRDYTTLSDM